LHTAHLHRRRETPTNTHSHTTLLASTATHPPAYRPRAGTRLASPPSRRSWLVVQSSAASPVRAPPASRRPQASGPPRVPAHSRAAVDDIGGALPLGLWRGPSIRSRPVSPNPSRVGLHGARQSALLAHPHARTAEQHAGKPEEKARENCSSPFPGRSCRTRDTTRCTWS